MGICGSNVDAKEYDYDPLAASLSSLQLVLGNSNARAKLKKFLQENYNDAHISFYIEVEEFKRAKEDELVDKAKAIFEKFIKTGAESEISISFEQKGEISEGLAAVTTFSSLQSRSQFLKETMVEAFTPAQKAVVELMALDAYPRFLQSPLGIELKKELTPTDNDLKKSVETTIKMIKKTNKDDKKWLERFIAAAEKLPCCICLTDMQNKEQPVVYINKEFEDVTLYSKEDVVGRNCRFLQGEETAKDSVQRIRDGVRDGKRVEICITNYRKNGDKFINFLSMKPIKNAAGVTRYFLGVQFDVTEAMKRGQLGVDMVYVDGLFKLLPNTCP